MNNINSSTDRNLSSVFLFEGIISIALQLFLLYYLFTYQVKYYRFSQLFSAHPSTIGYASSVIFHRSSSILWVLFLNCLYAVPQGSASSHQSLKFYICLKKSFLSILPFFVPKSFHCYICSISSTFLVRRGYLSIGVVYFREENMPRLD